MKKIITEPLTGGDTTEALRVIWQALHCFREDCIGEATANNDEQWDEVCTAMAWIEEDINAPEKAGGFSTEDVMGMRPDLNEAQALEVISLTNRWFDASIGINWHVLQHNAEHLFSDGEAWPNDK